jgi:tRNA-modifying protein YgfZ
MRLFQIIEVTGDGAESFLQGQLTQDVRRLGRSGSLPAAWCNPKGRVFCVMRMIKADGAIGLVVPAELAEPVVKRLTMYRLRARVRIALADPEWRCLAVTGAGDLDALAALDLLPERGAAARGRGLVAVELNSRPRCVELYGPRAAFDRSGLTIRQPLTDRQWQAALIDAGVPTVLAATAEKYTPHMLNLDRLGALSFDKGCYTGQEVVARTEHLGQAKRRLMHYRVAGGTPAVGDRLVHEEREVGDVVNAAGEELLAVVPVELHALTLAVKQRPASPVDLPYMS